MRKEEEEGEGEEEEGEGEKEGGGEEGVKGGGGSVLPTHAPLPKPWRG